MTNYPSKHNITACGRKAHNDNQYVKVGRIRMNSWAAQYLAVADILISERELVHIAKRHSQEMGRLGIDALLYVRSVINNANEIRKGNTQGTYLFIVKTVPFTKETVMHCAVVELSVSMENKKKIYKIKTAYPATMGWLSKNELICVKPRS